MNTSKRIIEIRERKKIKQSDIAIKLGIDQPNYSRLEKRGDKLTIEQLNQIADALGVSVAEILEIEVPESNETLEKNKKIEQLKEQLEEKEKYNKLLLDRLDRFESVLSNYLYSMVTESLIHATWTERTSEEEIMEEPQESDFEPMDISKLTDEELKIIFERVLVFDDPSLLAIDMGLGDKRLREIYMEHRKKMRGKNHVEYWFELLKNRYRGKISGVPVM